MRLDQGNNSDEQKPLKQRFCESLRRDTHWKCLILTVLISGCLAAITWCRVAVVNRVVVMLYKVPTARTDHVSPCDDGYIYIPIAFVIMLYLVYLVECWHCHTRIQLQCKVDVSSVYERIQSMREAIPVVWWKALCYHYVRRTRQVTRYRNGDAFTTTQVYYERVNTHSASAAFDFSHCGVKDVSKTLVNLDRYPATKIRFTKGFSFTTPEAENEFEEQRMQFFQEHERRDDYVEIREGLDLLNTHFKEYVIAFADSDHLPWYVSQVVFWLSSLFLLSWPLRVLIEYKTAYVHYHIHKLFGGNYLDTDFVAGSMTRVISMGSSELEMDIRNNYTIVPSYSEALLMESALRQDPNGNITFDRASLVGVNGSVNTSMQTGHRSGNALLATSSVIYGSVQASTQHPRIYTSSNQLPDAAALISPPEAPVKRRWKRKRRKTKGHRHSDGSLSQHDGTGSQIELRPFSYSLPRPYSVTARSIKHSNTFPHPGVSSPSSTPMSPESVLHTDSEDVIPPPPTYDLAMRCQGAPVVHGLTAEYYASQEPTPVIIHREDVHCRHCEPNRPAADSETVPGPSSHAQRTDNPSDGGHLAGNANAGDAVASGSPLSNITETPDGSLETTPQAVNVLEIRTEPRLANDQQTQSQGQQLGNRQSRTGHDRRETTL